MTCIKSSKHLQETAALKKEKKGNAKGYFLFFTTGINSNLFNPVWTNLPLLFQRPAKGDPKLIQCAFYLMLVAFTDGSKWAEIQ